MVDETSAYEGDGVVALDGAAVAGVPASEVERAAWYPSLGDLRAEGGRLRRRFRVRHV